MQLGLGLQSAVMYRTGKLFHGSSTTFVSFPLLIYVVTTILLLVVEGSGTSPSPSDLKNAQRVVGRFLRNEAGAAWLLGLVKKYPAPVSSENLVNELLKDTRKGGKVWNAANVLHAGLKSQTVNGTSSDTSFGTNESWKDLIESIEKEEDIICLYRKNKNDTRDKAEDWEKFLQGITPGYAVHMAIDTGHKYVICLKKIPVPETTIKGNSSIEGILTTSSTSSVLPQTTSQLPIKPHQNGNNTTSELPEELRGVTDLPPDKDDQSCETCEGGGVTNNGTDTEDEYIDDYDDEDYNIDYDYSSEEDQKPDKVNLRTKIDSSVKSDKIMKSRSKLDRPIGDRGLSSKTQDGRKFAAPPPTTSDRIVSEIAHNPECKREIIFVVQNGNGMSVFQPRLTTGIPIQQYFTPKLPWMPQYSIYKFLLAPCNYFPLWDNRANIMKTQNQANNIIGHNIPLHMGIHRPVNPQKTYFSDEISARKIHGVKSFVNPTPGRIQTTRHAHNSQFFNIKSQAMNNMRERLDFIKNSKYSISNSFPQWMNPSIPKMQKNLADQFRTPPSNILLQKRPQQDNKMIYDFLSRTNQARNEHQIRQLIKNPVNSRLPLRMPIFRPQQMVRSSLQKPIRQLPRPQIYNRSRLQQSPIANGRPLVQFPPPLIQNFNRIDPRLTDIFRPVQNRPHNPSMISNPMKNYPVKNNFVQRMGPHMNNPLIANIPCQTPSNPFYARYALDHLSYPFLRYNNPLNYPVPVGYQNYPVPVGCQNYPVPVGYQNYPVPCPRPCDRPIKIQIVIDGKIQEPVSPTVLGGFGQTLKVVGPGTAFKPYGSRSLTDERTEKNEFYDRDNIQPEIAQRMGIGEEEKEDAPSLGSKSVKSDDLKAEKNSPRQNENEMTNAKTTIESNDAEHIGERFLHYTTIRTSFNLQANETMTATNFTKIVL